MNVQHGSSSGTFTLTPILYGNAAAVDIPTSQMVTLTLQDLDSTTFNCVLLTAGRQGTTVDDTDFVTSSAGFLLVADRDGATVYAVTAPFLEPGSAYSASDSSGFVGALDFGTGVLTPVVSGMVSLHGMAFIPQL